MSQMLKSSGAMGAATLASRLLGLVREQVYAHFMGDTPVASAFKFAFLIPNTFRRLLGEGALTAAFIPIFKEKEKLEGEASMWNSANAVISGLIVAVSIVIGLALLLVSFGLSFPNFSTETVLMLRLLRVMLPYMLLVCLAAVFMGILNSRGHFFIPAMGASFLNVVMIASVLWLAPRMGTEREQQIFALAIGVLVAGVAQAGFQLPSLRAEGFRYRWVTPWRHETVRRVVGQMIPATIGVAAFQINILLTLGLSFWVDKKIVASFDYAVRLMEFPQGIFGISLATYLLPTLSGLAAEKKYPEFRSTLSQGVGYLVFVNALASALLVSLAEPMVRLIFERGLFGPASTQRAALALACLAPGLVCFSLVNVCARAFYALGDTRTPMRISIVCLALNLIFSWFLVHPYRQGGLGVANSLTSTLNVGLLLWALRKKLGTLEMAALRKTAPVIIACAGLAGVVAWLVAAGWDRQWGHGNLLLRLGHVFAPIAAATGLYLGLTHLLGVGHAAEILTLIRRRRTPAAAPR